MLLSCANATRISAHSARPPISHVQSAATAMVLGQLAQPHLLTPAAGRESSAQEGNCNAAGQPNMPELRTPCAKVGHTASIDATRRWMSTRKAYYRWQFEWPRRTYVGQFGRKEEELSKARASRPPCESLHTQISLRKA